MEIVPDASKTKQGFLPTVPLVEIVNAILYKLKASVQWPITRKSGIEKSKD